MENNNICVLAMNKDGEHLIEKIIKTFPEEKRLYVFDKIIENFKELATNK
jgi:predicted GTPase